MRAAKEFTGNLSGQGDVGDGLVGVEQRSQRQWGLYLAFSAGSVGQALVGACVATDGLAISR